jgi:hypothetical protein
MPARWEEALDARLDLYTFTQSERGRNYVKGWMRAETAPNDADGEAHLNMPTNDPMNERVADAAFTADTIWVDPDMQTLWEAAVPSFQPEALDATDLLTPSGFVYLSRPHKMLDVNERVTSARAYAWRSGPIQFKYGPEGERDTVLMNGIVLFSFHRVGDADDYDDGRGNSIDVLGGESLPYSAINLRAGDLLLDHVYPWPFGVDSERRVKVRQVSEHVFVSDPQGDEKAMTNTVTRSITIGNVEQHVQCLWRLMQQTIATRTQHDPSKPVRKRAKRANVDARKITVIRLRRPTSAGSDEHRSVEWSHRWLVGGHWRQQWYASIGAHRQIWISPYIKGPDDAPLDVRAARVFELVQ